MIAPYWIGLMAEGRRQKLEDRRQYKFWKQRLGCLFDKINFDCGVALLPITSKFTENT